MGVGWLLTCALTLSACAGFASNIPTRGTLKVLALGSYGSGTGSALLGSLNYEASRINADGGVAGYRIKVVALDDGGDPNRDAALLAQAAGDPTVKLVVSSFAGGTLAGLGPALASTGLLSCSTSSQPQSALSTAREFTISSQDNEATALMDYAARTLHLKRVGIIAASDATGQAEAQMISSAARGAGVSDVGARLVASTQIDQGSQIRQLENLGAQALVLSTDPSLAARTAMSLNALGQGTRPQLLGLAPLAGYSFAQLGGAGAAGTLVVAVDQSVLSTLAAPAWGSNYRLFIQYMLANFGTMIDGYTPKAVPAAADCLLGYANAANAASSILASNVARAWSQLDLAPGQDVLAMRERYTGGVAISPSSLDVYSWVQIGPRWELKPLA